MWDDLWAAVALVMVFEGLMPFINPMRWRNVMRVVTDQSDKTLRTMGLVSMLVGVAMLYIVRSSTM